MLCVENLTVQYAPTDARPALSHVCLTIENGEKVALLGSNGAGKSTLLLSLVGILSATEGSISVDSVQLQKETLRDIRRRLGLVFQSPDDQLFMPTVSLDVAFGPRNYGLSEEETAHRVKETLCQLGISHLRERMVHKLSGGEKRLAALAGVLVMEPSVLLLDEPTSFLDPQATQRLRLCLSALPQSLLLATHDFPFAAALCNRFVFLSHGEIVGDYSRQALEENPALLAAQGYAPLSSAPT